MNFLKKIRIGYVLKSADVRTLFSKRNSENSSHTHAYTHAYPLTHQLTPVHTRTHLRIPTHTYAYPSTPTHTKVVTYPLMPADALNFINHMK